MTKQEAITRKEQLEAELNQLQYIIDTNPTHGERFMELIKGFTVLPKHQDYPDSIFFEKDGQIFGDYDLKTGWFWVKYAGFWKVLETEYRLKYDQIQAIIKEQVEQAYGLKGVTPRVAHLLDYPVVEQAYGLKGGA